MRNECRNSGGLRACVAQSCRRRDAGLVARWLLEKPASTAYWACDGREADEVVTIFFATDLPSVRFERGDSVEVGVLVPTGSGSRCEGGSGSSMWIKGAEALYRDPDPGGQDHCCTLRRQD